ncbi:hypothetical protein TNCV_4913681 [Trichonephila clavipes]|nr:hypothetical protein TNCV_4913681 [Trichonephila clavipes]
MKKISLLGMNKIWETPAGMDCSISLLREGFIEVDDDNVCVCIPNYMADKDILVFVQNSNKIIDANSYEENEMRNILHVLTSSEMRNGMKSMRSYLVNEQQNERYRTIC